MSSRNHAHTPPETLLSSEEPKYPQHWGRRSRRTKFTIIGVLIAVILIALAVGLGVGLSLRNRNNDNDSNDSSSTPTLVITSSPLPSTPANQQIWQPAVKSSWQIVLNNPIQLSADNKSVVPDVDVYDVDLFNTPQSTIQQLQALGKKVICYFSAGSYEPNRPDSSQFHTSDSGKVLKGWKDERWLNLASANVRSIMLNRIQLAKQKGCDGIDPDNTDAYNNDNGLGMTADDSINFIGYLATVAQNNSLAIGLKNSDAIVSYVLPAMQWEVNEQCVQYGECKDFDAFIQQGKPVFHIEYPGEVKRNFVSNLCNTDSNGAGDFSTVLKNLDLDGYVKYCNGSTYTTPQA